MPSPSPPAVLCLHGLTSTPYEFGPLVAALEARGVAVSAPYAAGHGTRPEALSHTRFLDWLSSARRAFEALTAEHERVFLVGLSMGALCGITLAHEGGGRVAGLVSMATPLRFPLADQLALQAARHLPLAALVPYVLKKSGPDVSDPAVAAAMPGYDRIPLAAAASLIEGQRHAFQILPRLACPVLLQHGRHDHVAPVRNLDLAWHLLKTPHRRRLTYARSCHILPVDVEHEAVVADVLAFMDDPIAFCRGDRPAARSQGCAQTYAHGGAPDVELSTLALAPLSPEAP